jgi:hypothetical protein
MTHLARDDDDGDEIVADVVNVEMDSVDLISLNKNCFHSMLS